MSMFLKIWCISFVIMLFYFEFTNFSLSPSNILKNIELSMQEITITISLTDKYSIQKGGSLFSNVYNEYHYFGKDVNGTSWHFINTNDTKYYFANINSTMNFICTNANKIKCK